MCSTKDKILETSLELFSKYGYDGVSIDKIAESIGIKGPSIYKHFKGKEDILRQLLDLLEMRYIENVRKVSNTVPSNKQEFIESAWNYIEFTRTDESIVRTRRFITIQQYKDEGFGDLATKHSLNFMLRMYGEMFKELIEKGIVKDDDPWGLALSFTAPVTIFINAGDRPGENKEEYDKAIKKYLNYFADKHFVK